ncbi:YybH family protein [Altererythrobacter sp. MF3-039]|uniref:YybH family protein n=1 Tax=Altererythrobacter sp. MF3-039 TaxID=3252901 RepID=UPI00390C4C83
MRQTMRILLLPLIAMAMPAQAQTPLTPGIWTNVEDRSFAEEEGRETPPEMAFRIADDGRWQPIDAFGEAQADWQSIPLPGLNKRSGGGWEVSGSELRLARPFKCWFSVRKFAAKPDGSDDWSFQNNLAVFDQGGKVKVGGGDAPEATMRLRNVTWAKGSSNAPSLVIYAHRDHAERATSYSWAGPDSDRVGLNLRWLQGSCTRDDEAMGATAESLAAAGAEWNAALQAQDWKALRALYSDDVWLMTDKAPALKDADAIVRYLRRFADQGAKTSFEFEPEDVQVDYPYGFVTSPYRMAVQVPGRDEPIRSAGRALLIYKWQDGGWKLWRDMDNTTPDVTLDETE